MGMAAYTETEVKPSRGIAKASLYSVFLASLSPPSFTALRFRLRLRLLDFLFSTDVFVSPSRERSAHFGVEFHARPLRFAVSKRAFPRRKTATGHQRCYEHSRAAAAAVRAVH